MEKGHYVEINIARGRKAKVIITDIVHKWRARKWPYEIKFKDPCSDSTYYGKRNTLLYSDDPGTKFISDSHEGADQCILEYENIAESRQDKKDEILKENQSALRKFNIDVGDVVLFGYSNGTQEEVVAAVNWNTGKIAIERFSPSQKKRYLETIKSTNMLREDFISLYPQFSSRRKVDRSKRWLNAKNIIRKVESVPTRTASELLQEVRKLKKLAYSETELMAAMLEDGISKKNAENILYLLEDAIDEMWGGAGWRAWESFTRKAKRLGLEEYSSSYGKLNEYYLSQS